MFAAAFMGLMLEIKKKVLEVRNRLCSSVLAAVYGLMNGFV